MVSLIYFSVMNFNILLFVIINISYGSSAWTNIQYYVYANKLKHLIHFSKMTYIATGSYCYFMTFFRQISKFHCIWIARLIFMYKNFYFADGACSLQQWCQQHMGTRTSRPQCCQNWTSQAEYQRSCAVCIKM